MSEQRFLATCPKGLGSLLHTEVGQLGGTEVRETVTGVEFLGAPAVAYRVCLWSRFANRVLLVLGEFAAAGADDLYAGVAALPWTEHLPPGKTIAVDFSGKAADIRNTQFGAQRCKDAVVDRVRSAGRSRPDVDLRQPDLRINVRLWRGKVTVSLDLAGESLHRRGYRLDGGKAPLKENLAAAILARAQWPARAREGWPLVDPMCGSGTLLVEAAMIALNRAPGLGREHYGFLGWSGHNPEQWRMICQDARDQALPAATTTVEIRGYDGDITAVRRAEDNIRRLGFEDFIRVRAKGLDTLVRPTHTAMPRGLLVCNPPWGERLSDVDTLRHLYRSLGERLDAEFRGWDAAVLTANTDLGHAIGLRSHRQYRFASGQVDLTLLLFHLNAENRLTDPAPQLAANPPAPEFGGAAAGTTVLSPGAEMFANRVRKNQRRLRPWLSRSGVSCYRVYDADMPEYALAVDVYEGRLHVAEYAAPKGIDEGAAQRRLDEAVAALPVALGLPDTTDIAVKQRRRQSGSAQYARVSHRGERLVVQEGRAKVLVNLHDYLDTGLFLDHRPLRERLGREAAGCHFLNLFCYTGVATLHAALGGAHTTTSVDLSKTYLAWFAENLAINGLSDRQHRAERADCLAWLEAQTRFWDLILLDPPSFSNSKAMDTTLDVQRDHVALIEAAMARLAPGGTLYFSNNLRRFRLDPTIGSRFQVEDITRQTIPPDFERRHTIHHCWRIAHH